MPKRTCRDHTRRDDSCLYTRGIIAASPVYESEYIRYGTHYVFGFLVFVFFLSLYCSRPFVQCFFFYSSDCLRRKKYFPRSVHVSYVCVFNIVKRVVHGGSVPGRSHANNRRVFFSASTRAREYTIRYYHNNIIYSSCYYNSAYIEKNIMREQCII